MSNETLRWILEHIPLIVGVSTIIGIWKFKSIKKARPEILLFLGLSAFFEILSRALYSKSVNNLPYLHLYTFLEFLVVSSFYYSTLATVTGKKALRILIVLFSLWAVINAFFVQGLYAYNSYVRPLECLIIMAFSLVFYYKMLNELETQTPIQNSDFWINTGFFLYFSGSFVLFVLSNVLTSESYELNMTAWAMHAFLMGILHTLIIIGLWKIIRQ